VNVDFTTNLWAPLAAVTGFLWLATAIGMIFTREHPYANRWAWFWLFVIGGVGPMLILWKEPAPLRLRFWRRDTEPHRWTQPPMTGGIGLLMAIGWTIGITAVAYSLGWLASS
jgi:drug/metabolite transporter (DMT)-like permease